MYTFDGYYTTDPTQDIGVLGGTLYCRTPNAQPVLIVIFLISFTFIIPFAFLSLIIGSIGDAMMEASLEMRKKFNRKKITWQQKDAKDIIRRMDSNHVFTRKRNSYRCI